MITDSITCSHHHSLPGERFFPFRLVFGRLFRYQSLEVFIAAEEGSPIRNNFRWSDYVTFLTSVTVHCPEALCNTNSVPFLSLLISSNIGKIMEKDTSPQ